MHFDRLFESEAECEADSGAESKAECEAYFTVLQTIVNRLMLVEIRIKYIVFTLIIYLRKRNDRTIKGVKICQNLRRG